LVGEQDTLLEHPKPEDLSKLFARPRVVVQIVGPGGAGKTSLAMQVARWLFDAENDGVLMGHPTIVVLLDEDTTDIRAAVKGRIRSWLELDDDIPDRLLDVLLKKRRLVVLFDRVSERRPEVISAVERVHSRVALNALLVTSRRTLNFEGTSHQSLHPEPLGSGTLLYFVTALLRDHEDFGGFSHLTDQLRLGEQFIPLLRTEVIPGDIPVTPLLVRLFVDRAIERLRTYDSLEKLPTSIPDLYFDYLRRVNPTDTGHSVISHSEMLRAAQTVAILALGSDLVPKEFSESEAQSALPAHEDDGPRVLDRLLENGVLSRRDSGAETILRFVLDPVAEYLAAFAYAQRAGSHGTAWADLINNAEAAEHADGFALALKLTWERYHRELGWAPAFGAINLETMPPIGQTV
jgi:hypothetical protein